MQKKNSLIALVCFSILNSSCALNPPDVPVCVEITMEKAWCRKTISNTEFYIDEKFLYEGKTWWELRPAMVLVPAPSWAKIKAFSIKVCKKYGDCSKDIDNWERGAATIDEKLKEKGAELPTP